MSAGPVPVLRDVVAQEVAAWRALGASPGAWLTGELLVRWGITFNPAPLPAKIERGVPRACFYNARKLVARRRGTLRYAEGLAMAA